MKIKKGQRWQDKKTGDAMTIGSRAHDMYWNVLFDRGNTTHRMTEFIIKKYYTLCN